MRSPRSIRHVWTGSAIALAATLLASAQSVRERNWKEVCALATARPLAIPSVDAPEPEHQLQSCDEVTLYYGFGSAPDPQAALQCGYYQRAHPNPTQGNPFYGPGVLSMLYANGKGVPRDYERAMRFACENTWAAPAEMESRIGHLEALRSAPTTTSTFDLCDDATSGLMAGACEGIAQRFADEKRRQRLEAISKNWSPAVRNAFTALQAAERHFEEIRPANELDRSGTGAASFMAADEGRLKDQFLINLERFAKGDVPAASLATQRSLELRLDTVYQKIQLTPTNAWMEGSVTQASIKTTQDAWVVLRDAWVTFGRVAYPKLTTASLVSQIIRLRADQLDRLTSWIQPARR